MKRKVKGIALSTVILGVLLVVAVVAIIWLLGHGGFGLGGGKGDGAGKESEAVPASATVSETSEASETTTVTTAEMTYLPVTVFGGDYLYQDSVYSLEELIEEIKKTDTDAMIMVIDKGASKNAYDSLINALGKNNISYMEDISD